MHLGEKPISPLGRLELKGWWTSGRRESQGLVSVSEIHHSGDDVRNQCVEPRDRQPSRKRKKSKMYGLHVLLPSQGLDHFLRLSLGCSCLLFVLPRKAKSMDVSSGSPNLSLSRSRCAPQSITETEPEQRPSHHWIRPTFSGNMVVQQ